MSYTAPVYTASGQTWANLQNRGFEGFTKTLLAGLGIAAHAKTSMMVSHLLTPNNCASVIERARNTVDNYINGKSDKTNAKVYIFDLQEALGVLAAALGEIGVLIDAN